MVSYSRMAIYFDFIVMCFLHVLTRLSYSRTACWGPCWSLRLREDYKCGREFVLVAKPKKRCCEADKAMLHLPIGQAARIEYWLIYASIRVRLFLTRREYGFRAF